MVFMSIAIIKFSLYSNVYLYKKKKKMFNKTFNKNAFLTREIKFKEINRSFDTVAKIYYIVLNLLYCIIFY